VDTDAASPTVPRPTGCRHVDRMAARPEGRAYAEPWHCLVARPAGRHRRALV